VISLRDYQGDVIERARQALRRRRRILLQAPTGAGKTAIATFMASEAAARGRVVYFICHRAELVEGTSATFRKYGLDHGIIAAGRPLDPTKRVQVCSIDTLKNRVAFIPRPDLAIWDECHHIGAAGWAAVMQAWSGSIHIGLSATPQRLDGKGLDAYFDEIVLGPSVAWLIENGHLSPYKAFAPSAPDMSGVRRQAGDWARGQAAERMNKPKLTGDAITHWLRHANGLRTVGFGVTVEHSQHLAAQFVAAGIPAAHLDGGTRKDLRRKIIQDYAAGLLSVIFNVDLFGEGFDLSAIAQRDVTVDCVMQLRPTQSLALHLQQVGRALRPAPGKTAIILDHAGNFKLHGFPDDEREWSLEGREATSGGASEREGPPPPYECACFMQIRRPLPLRCPHCDRELKPEARAIEVEDGDLVELTDEDRRRMRYERQREERDAKNLAELVAIGQRRGYPSPQAWAFKRWAARPKEKTPAFV
jgi:superfamily II DNA or RNA helicase